MRLRFYYDPDTDQPHIYHHNVDEAEVKTILRNPVEDAKGTNDTRVAIGRTSSGRIIKIIYKPDEVGDGIFVITAYDLTGKSLAAFRRRMRRRRR